MNAAQLQAAPAPLDKEIAEAWAVVQRLQALGKEAIDLPSPPDSDDPQALAAHAIDVVVKCQQGLDQIYAVQGYYLLWLKEHTEHGELELAYERAGIKPQTAQRRMRVARLLLALDESKASYVTLLPFSRQLQLVNLGPGAIEEMEQDGVLEQLAELPERQFQAVLKERKARQQVQAQLEKYQDEYRQDLHRKKIKETVLQGIPDAIQQARRYSALVGNMGMELSIRGQMIFERTLSSSELHADQNLRAIQFRQSTRALLAGVDAGIKALLDLREHIVEHAGDVSAEKIPGLLAIELDEAMDNYHWMLKQHGERAEHVGVPEGRTGRRKKKR